MEAGGSQRVGVLSQSPGPWKDLDWTSKEWQAVRRFRAQEGGSAVYFCKEPLAAGGTEGRSWEGARRLARSLWQSRLGPGGRAQSKWLDLDTGLVEGIRGGDRGMVCWACSRYQCPQIPFPPGSQPPCHSHSCLPTAAPLNRELPWALRAPFPGNALETLSFPQGGTCGFHSCSRAPMGPGQGDRVAETTLLHGSLPGPSRCVSFLNLFPQ